MSREFKVSCNFVQDIETEREDLCSLCEFIAGCSGIDVCIKSGKKIENEDKSFRVISKCDDFILRWRDCGNCLEQQREWEVTGTCFPYRSATYLDPPEGGYCEAESVKCTINGNEYEMPDELFKQYYEELDKKLSEDNEDKR